MFKINIFTMGNRLSKIYTRTGDKGETGLADGSRVAKDHPRTQAMGDVDELNSWIGMVRSRKLPGAVETCLAEIQHRLFDLGGELSMPGHDLIQEKLTTELEQALNGFNEALPYLKEFILPAGDEATTCCHLARSVCRRAERSLVTLDRQEKINPHSLVYLNRLSDLLFVIARVLARANNGSEVYWKPYKP